MEEGKLTKLQEAELEILKEFLKICEKEGLRYYIWGGSLLGAVRHKGFIPWDDDIDVAMPRKDFEQFLLIASRELSDNFKLSTYDSNPDHITLVAQIFNKNKEFVLHSAAKKVQTGAWLDILVIDGAPKKGFKRKVFTVKYMYMRMMNQFAHFDEIVNLTKKRPWYEKLAIRFAQLTKIQRWLNPIKLGNKFHDLLKKNDYETASEVATFMGAAKMKEIIPKSYIGSGKKYTFEDIQVVGPDMYDEYLTHFYNDYMTPPPIEQRNRHNVKEK